MKKRIVRLTESDLEKLVQRIIKEDKASTAEVKMTFMDRRTDITKLAPAEKEMMNNVANKFLDFFLQPGNQAVGKINTYLDRVFKQMEAKTKDKGKKQPTTPSKDDENFDF
jgi:hypothetical protein